MPWEIILHLHPVDSFIVAEVKIGPIGVHVPLVGARDSLEDSLFGFLPNFVNFNVLGRLSFRLLRP